MKSTLPRPYPRLHPSLVLLMTLLVPAVGCPGDSDDIAEFVLDIKCGSKEVEVGDVIELRAILTARATVESCDDDAFEWVVINEDVAEIDDQETDYDGSNKSLCESVVTLVGLEPGKTKVTLTAAEGEQSKRSCTITVTGSGTKRDGSTKKRDSGPEVPECATPDSVEIYTPAGGHVCDHTKILKEDKAEAGLGYILGDTIATIDGEEVIACVKVDFGEVQEAKTAQVVVRAVNSVCGAKCTAPACGSGHTATLLGSADGSAFKYIEKLFISGSRERYTTAPLTEGIRYLLVCRSGVGSARDHLKVDYAELCF